MILITSKLTPGMVANVCVVGIGDPKCSRIVVGYQHAIGHLVQPTPQGTSKHIIVHMFWLLTGLA